MGEGWAPYPMAAQPIRNLLGFYVIPGARQDTEDQALRACKSAPQTLETMEIGVGWLSMEEEQAIHGRFLILSMIQGCLEDARMTMEKVSVKKMVLSFIQNAILDIIL